MVSTPLKSPDRLLVIKKQYDMSLMRFSLPVHSTSIFFHSSSLLVLDNLSCILSLIGHSPIQVFQFSKVSFLNQGIIQPFPTLWDII